jgi:hypothetical protein
MLTPCSPTGSTQKAEDHVVDLCSVEPVAVAQRLQRGDGQMDRRGAVQCARGATLAAGRTHGIVDESVGHGLIEKG